MTLGSLWNYHRDEVIEDANENNEAGKYRINNNKTTSQRVKVKNNREHTS